MNLEDINLADELNPTDGSVFAPDPDEAIVEEVNEEKTMIRSSAPVMKYLFDFLDEQIAYTDSIKKIDSNKDINVQILAQKEVSELLTAVRYKLTTLDEEFNTKR